MNYSYNYYTESYTGEGLLGALAGLTIFLSIIALAASVFAIIVMWKIFKKAGKEGWISLIPLYNIYTLFEITWGKGWYCLLLLTILIPIIGWIASAVVIVMTMLKLAKSFGKDTPFAIGLIFLNIIFLAILAFDKSTYLGVPKDNKNNTDTRQPEPANQFENVQSNSVAPMPPATPVVEPVVESPVAESPTAPTVEPPVVPTPVVEPAVESPVAEAPTEPTVEPPVTPIPSNDVQPVIVTEPKTAGYCANCGQSLPTDSVFCPNCGTPKAS